MIDIGLDISTSCTGVCILNVDSSLVDLQFIKLSHLDGLWKKSDAIRDAFLQVSRNVDLERVRYIFVEENLQMFRPGLSSAKTLTTLSRFNGIVSYIAREIFSADPVSVNVNHARKAVGLKLDRKDKIRNTKQQVFDWVEQQIATNNYEWPTKVLKSGPRKGTIILEPGCYDMADAYVACRAGQLSCT